MKICVLGSSSSGNSTYVECGNTKFLIDVGFSYSYIKEKLLSIDVKTDEIDFIIITHAHNDHVKCLHTFARMFNTKVYIGKETYSEYINRESLKNYEFVEGLDNIGDIELHKIPISHDKKGFGFVFTYDGKSLVYMTDTGMIHSRYHELLTNKEVYLLESNHDVDMEMHGSKDQMTKIRNIGDMGHLSNEQCSMYLNHFIGKNTKYIMLMHISEHDNTYELAYKVNRESIDKRIEVYITKPTSISEIIEL